MHCLDSAAHENLGDHDIRLDKTEKLKVSGRVMQICDSIIQAKIAVVPAKRAAASASRDPVTPVVLILMDRGYWIPAFAGMTVVK